MLYRLMPPYTVLFFLSRCILSPMCSCLVRSFFRCQESLNTRLIQELTDAVFIPKVRMVSWECLDIIGALSAQVIGFPLFKRWFLGDVFFLVEVSNFERCLYNPHLLRKSKNPMKSNGLEPQKLQLTDRAKEKQKTTSVIDFRESVVGFFQVMWNTLKFTRWTWDDIS